MEHVREKEKKAFGAMKGKFAYATPMAAPRLEKIILSSGTGSSRKDKTRKELIPDRLAKIAGQKTVPALSKKSIASFKLRDGEVIGHKVTLRRGKMYDFLDRFLNIAVPRMRDFRGFDRKIVDEAGNLTVGIKEHNIFPETAVEDVRDVFGLAVTMVTTARSREEAMAFFESLGFPFKKEESKAKK